MVKNLAAYTKNLFHRTCGILYMSTKFRTMGNPTLEQNFATFDRRYCSYFEDNIKLIWSLLFQSKTDATQIGKKLKIIFERQRYSLQTIYHELFIQSIINSLHNCVSCVIFYNYNSAHYVVISVQVRFLLKIVFLCFLL